MFTDYAIKNYTKVKNLLSYDNQICDIINEIPNYFSNDYKWRDDMEVIEINTRRSSIKLNAGFNHRNSIRSAERTKSINEVIRKKSILGEDSYILQEKTKSKEIEIIIYVVMLLGVLFFVQMNPSVIEKF